MKKKHAIIIALLAPLVAILFHSVGQSKNRRAKLESAEQNTISKELINLPDANDRTHKESFEEKKSAYEEMKRDGMLAAQKFARASTPESIRISITNGLKSREKRYRGLMNSLNIPKAKADKILATMLERNVKCYEISMAANTESDFTLKELIRSGQGPVRDKARQDMIKIVGGTNVQEIDLLEKAFLDEVTKGEPSILTD